jgi:hypothetical protein
VSGCASSVDNRSSLSTEKTTPKRKTGTADLTAVEGALQLLARAVRQFHTYPSTSPLCVDAIMACHDALKSIQHRDRLVPRVAPHDLIVDDTHIGAGTVVEQELTRRLFKLRVAALEIECGATPRDLSRFCIDLVESDDLQGGADGTFAERLAEHGVAAIIPEMAQRPVVMDVGVPQNHAQDLITHERQRQQELAQPDGPVSYLYPPDRGWVRTDPAEGLSQVSLLDLVILVDDPAEIATLLVRLTDDDLNGPDARQVALERKYTDVTRLFSALDPRLAQVMFGKLARAVLNLDTDRRNNLLQRTILPGLLDGDANGKVLRDFPDMDLAESICLLLDLETAAPEVLSAALNRLDLTADRREALVPLIEQRMRTAHGGQDPDEMSLGSSGVERHARELIRIDAARDTDFSEFAAFDLSMDAQAETAVTDIRNGIVATDVPMAQLLCASQLVRIERNPTLVEAFLRRALELLGALERAGRWPDVIDAVAGYGRLGEELRSRRPDVTDAIAKAMSDYCTPTRLLALATLHERDEEGRAFAELMLKALGTALVPGLVELMNRSAHEARARALVPLICEMAPTIAPALVAEFDSCGAIAARVIVKVLGHAGAGHEAAVGRLAEHQDSQVAREAMRALARIGTPTAAAMVARQIREAKVDQHSAAEDALWHFPAAQTATQVRELLRSREFVLSHPQTAARLIDRAGQARVQGLDDTLTKLEGLRFRFWKPSLVQVALKARELRAR